MFMILSLAACGNSESRTEQPSTKGNSVEGTTSNSTSIENSNTSTENGNTGNEESTSSEKPQPQETKVLVAYFSATNTTEGVAEHIANGLNANLYEIVPKEPYTSKDLDYNDNNSRSTIEMKNSDSRPAISGSVENMEQYDIVFIGFVGVIIGLN